ncbi:MAG: DNA polymerase III subunit gamma/tau, partial [Pseudanabaenaceae cyanobacterium]
MAYEPLHHKYRPQTLADLVGQEAIAATLSQALKTNRIAPAYLLTGSRGTGKTSTARILAKSLNCLTHSGPTPHPCGTCEMCVAIAKGTALDVSEIDAASHTGVDNIREIIERAQFAPVQARYKVYAIDECHMLSTAAFNALLKTLEEPPAHVVFILATTDPQRVLPTIVSRCQRFDFRRIPPTAAIAHLRHIADQEHIAIEEEALRLVVQLSQGGLRDAESLLDQLSLLPGPVTPTQVWDLVGVVPEQDLLRLLAFLGQGQGAEAIALVRRIADRGREPMVILQNLAGLYRDLLIAKTAPDRPELVALSAEGWAQLQTLAQSYSVADVVAAQTHLRQGEPQLRQTTQPRLWLEIILMGLLPAAPPANVSPPPAHFSVPKPDPTPPSAPLAAQKPHIVSPPTRFPEAQPDPLPVDAPTSSPPAPVASPAAVPAVAPDLQTAWQALLKALPPATRGLLTQHGTFDRWQEDQITVAMTSTALQKIAENKQKEIAEACTKVFGRPMKVTVAVRSPQSPV